MRRTDRRSRRLAIALSSLLLIGLLPMAGTASAAGPSGADSGAFKAQGRMPARHRGTVDVSRLPDASPGTIRAGGSPFLTAARSAGGSRVQAISPTTAVPSVPVVHPPAGQPGWEGFEFDDSGREPPDPWVAVGPDHVVQSVNTVVQMWDRNGAVELSGRDIAVDQFFALPLGYLNSDPRFIYDSVHGRWVGTEISWICDFDDNGTFDDPVGFLDFIVSRTADPTGQWDLWYYGFDGQIPDFPAPGTSTDKLGFAANLFDLEPTEDCTDGASYFGAELLINDWADVLALGGGDGIVDAAEFQSDQTIFTPRFAVQAPAASPFLHYVAQEDDGADINLIHGYFTGSAVIPQGQPGAVTEAGGGVVAGTEFVEPPSPQQPGGTVTDSIDSRPTDAIWQNNRLTVVSTGGCTPTGDDTERACVRVMQLNTTTATSPTLVQDFTIGTDNEHNYFGGVGQALDGTLHVVWTNSSTTASDYPSSWTAYQLPADPDNSLTEPQQLRASQGGMFTGGRWGDYVGVAQDPQVPNAVWQANQYSRNGHWGTYVSMLRPPDGSSYTAITPYRLVDSRVPLGVAGIFNASVPRTFSVAGVGPIPDEAVAVTANVTVTGQTAAGFFAVTPNPTATPTSSTINFPVGDNRANNLTIPLNSAGNLSAVYKAVAGQRSHFIVDITGYFVAGADDALLSTITPVRKLDTRIGTGLAGRFNANTPRTLLIEGGDIPTQAVAITANLTVVGQTKAGFVSVTPEPDATPDTSTLNFPLNDVRANGLTVGLSTDGKVSLVYKAVAGAKTDLLLDVTGYYAPGPGGNVFYALSPGRVMDSRTTVLTGLTGLFTGGSPRPLQVGGHWGVPPDAEAITGNLTVVAQTGAGFASLTPVSDTTPDVSNLNFPLGDIRANGVTVPLNQTMANQGKTWVVYGAGSSKRTHFILDVTGYFAP